MFTVMWGFIHHYKTQSIILPDIPVSLIKKILVLVQAVFEQGFAQGQLDFALACMGTLPAVKTHVFDNLVNITHHPFNYYGGF